MINSDFNFINIEEIKEKYVVGLNFQYVDQVIDDLHFALLKVNDPMKIE